MKKTIVTHSGGFHADDVFAVATLILKFGDAEVIRTRDSEIISKADIAVDIGGEYDPTRLRFDHHQKNGAGARENGIPYASFGLVWKEFGSEICGSPTIANIIEKKLVFFIDALDNGVTIDEPKYDDFRSYTISDYLYSYWVDENITSEEIDKIFHRVMNMAKDLLLREIEKSKRIEEEGKLVLEIYDHTEDKRLIILDQHYAWGKVLISKPEPLFVVYPGIDRKGWNAKSMRINWDSFELRKKFPDSWAGKMGSEMSEVSGVHDSVFCHKGGFLAVAQTKEGAVALAKKALDA